MAAITKTLDVLTAPFKGGEDTITADQSRTIAFVYHFAGAVLGSMVARQRAAAGKEPIAKILF